MPGLQATPASQSSLDWTLRIGACMCFVGHGAFGVITKAAWVPYFGVVGIGSVTAYRLMPLIGTLDICLGLLVLVRPMRAPLVWMFAWAVWTALLRPLSGESAWEAVERAGNYGVPLALLVPWSSAHRPLRLFAALNPSPAMFSRFARPLRIILTTTTVLLLLGHGALGVEHKAGLIRNYASVTALHASQITPIIGWLEIALAATIALCQSVPLLLIAAAWKIATEALFLTSGSPFWEFVERGGSYTAPIALAILLVLERNSVDASAVDAAADF